MHVHISSKTLSYEHYLLPGASCSARSINVIRVIERSPINKTLPSSLQP